MKSYLFLIASCLLLQSCFNDPPPEPVNYTYKSLRDTTSSYLHPFELHMFADTSADFYFTVGLTHDTRGTHANFFMLPLKSNRVQVKGEGDIPVFANGDAISGTLATPYRWDKITGKFCELIVKDPPPIDSTWEGAWSGAVKKYIPVQLHDHNKVYNGWISMSIDTVARKMILHEFGWNKIAGENAVAGRR
ncbi:hypothetical protein [Chitinophaga defluvii]|uniref:Lipoprotein n=1 Tax=Chitinophaga defluvii TaxID=3163343 RepID=A0ABV2TAI3_9BACT